MVIPGGLGQAGGRLKGVARWCVVRRVVFCHDWSKWGRRRLWASDAVALQPKKGFWFLGGLWRWMFWKIYAVGLLCFLFQLIGSLCLWPEFFSLIPPFFPNPTYACFLCFLQLSFSRGNDGVSEGEGKWVGVVLLFVEDVGFSKKAERDKERWVVLLGVSINGNLREKEREERVVMRHSEER